MSSDGEGLSPQPDHPEVRPTLLYEQLADDLAQSIIKGVFKAGEKLPSLRKLASQRKLSLSTVIEAFRQLEDRGLIEARPQAGFYVRKQASLNQIFTQPAQTNPATVVVNRLLFHSVNNADQSSFGYAILNPDLFPNAQLQKMMMSLTRRTPTLLSNYGTPDGDISLRRQIARRSLEWGAQVTADDVMITSGGIEALSIALRATTQPGDVVAIESPTYFGLLQLLESLQLKALEIPTNPQTGVSVEALEFATRHGGVKAVVLMPNFNNPLGSLMSDTAKKAVVELLASRNIPLIEDDIYGEFYYGDDRPRPAKSYDRTGNVLYIMSFTKVLAPGMRVGAIMGGRFQKQLKVLKYINTFSTPVVLQQTTAEFLANGGFDHHMRKLRKACAEQVEKIAESVMQHFPAGTYVNVPAGGYILWVELPKPVDCIELMHVAGQQGIHFAPGTLFSASQYDYRNCMRLCCGMRWSAETEAKIRKLGELAQEQLERKLSTPPIQLMMSQ